MAVQPAELPAPGSSAPRSLMGRLTGHGCSEGPWLQLSGAHVAKFSLLALLLTDAAILCAEVELTVGGHVDELRALLTRTAPLFDVLYLVELVATLLTTGLAPYFMDSARVFDMAVTLTSAIADFAAFAQGWPAHATRLALALRTPRLLRLLTLVSRFQSILRRLLRLLPQLSGLFGALWFLFSVYAQLGVFLFGGKIYAGDAYERSSGAEDAYTYCNFNDFGSAFVSLFELLVVNNWQVIMGEVAIVTRSNWSRAYFISWYIIAALVMTNLLVAFILQEMAGKEETDTTEMERHEVARREAAQAGRAGAEAEGEPHAANPPTILTLPCGGGALQGSISASGVSAGARARRGSADVLAGGLEPLLTR